MSHDGWLIACLHRTSQVERRFFWKVLISATQRQALMVLSRRNGINTQKPKIEKLKK